MEVLKKSQTKERPRGVWATAVYGGGSVWRDCFSSQIPLEGKGEDGANTP